MKILYFTFIENPFAPENSGVMRGQVINVLKKLGSTKQDCKIEWLAVISQKTYVPNLKEINALQKELAKENIKLKISFIPDEKFKCRWNFACKELTKKVQEFKPNIVHCRAYPATYVALKLKNKYNFKVIFDPRGIYPEQIKERSPNIIGEIRYLMWKYHEKTMLKTADLTVGVSESFIDHYKKIYKKGNYKTIPCCFEKKSSLSETQIEELKHKLNFMPEEIIITYSGNISAKYSSVELIVELMSKISKLKSNARFLFLTRSNTQKLIEHLKQDGLEDKTQILNLKPDEVHQYVSISDIGILYRQESKVNEVAMPTKLAEYLTGGVPVIASTSLKGITGIISQNEVGITLENTDITEVQIDKLLIIDKNKCIESAENFTTEKIAEQFYGEYMNLMN